MESIKANGYDISKDRRGEVFWHALFESLPNEFNLKFKKQFVTNPSPKELVTEIINEFKSCIEDNGLWKELWADSQQHRDEKASQRLFYAFSFMSCKANNLDMTPEANAGAGPIDFKFSQGNVKVLIEVKLSTNTSLSKGYEKQLEAYKKAERSDAAFYMVIQLDDQKRMDDKIEKLVKIKNDQAKLGIKTSEIVVIDGRRKKSASNL